MTTRSRRKKRLSRTDWLALSMDVLSRDGAAKLNIDNLCQALGVTKGSFYAHFNDRADFVVQFVAYWGRAFTQSAVEEIDEMADASAAERLLALMQLLHRQRLARYDAAVRAWAAQEPKVALAVRNVDSQRFDYVRRIFHDLGFRGADLDLRTRLFVVFHSSELSMKLPPSQLKADEEIRLLHAFLIRP